MLKSMTISEMAARWYLKKREHSLDLVERAEFEQWLAADPRHVKEYDSIANAMQMLRSPEKQAASCRAVGRCLFTVYIEHGVLPGIPGLANDSCHANGCAKSGRANCY
jgi:hypothetical protein